MKSNSYVIINDRAYDPVTGLPVEGAVPVKASVSEQPAAVRSEHASRGIATPKVHVAAQRSKTLSRRYLRAPIAPSTEAVEVQSLNYSPVSPNQFTVKKAASVQKFAKPKAKSPQVASRATRPAEAHPVVRRASMQALDISAPRRQRVATQQNIAARADIAKPQAAHKELKPAHILKNEAIFEAMSKEVPVDKKHRRPKQRKSNSWAKFLTLASSSLAIVMLAGYLTYLNMPNLSIRMAAVQSGINAKYPGYRPDGYALRGPISFGDGEVSMQFAYADGAKNFTIKQEKSDWNSSAVREFVDSKSKDTTTTNSNGLTIYTYGSNAAWVNHGVLYTLEGDAPLSSEQIQRIANSM